MLTELNLVETKRRSNVFLREMWCPGDLGHRQNFAWIGASAWGLSSHFLNSEDHYNASSLITFVAREEGEGARNPSYPLPTTKIK